MAYPEGLLLPGERMLSHVRPHWRMLVLPVVVPPVAVGLGAWLAGLASTTPWRTPLQIALAVVVAAVVVWFSLAPLVRWRCTHLVVTDRRLLVREGVVSRAGIDVAGSSVTSVRTRQTFLERTLRCGTLVVATQGASDAPWEFDGIGDVTRIAAEFEEVAEARGGLRADDEADDPDDPDPVDLDDPDPADPDDSDSDDWGAWDDADVEEDGGRAPARRFSRRRARAGRTSR